MDRFDKAQRERKAFLAAAEVCPLEDYRERLQENSRPSEEQITRFVGHVAEDHSWYKHLPLLAPGERFVFFVDPSGDRDRSRQPVGGTRPNERSDDLPALQGLPDERTERIARFGHLFYATVSAPRIMIVGEGGVEDRSELPIFHTPDGSFRLPPEVVDTGAVELTAAIHPETARVWVWQSYLPLLLDPELGGSCRFWPPETGGEKTLQQVVDLCRRRESEPLTDRIDPELQELLRPERERQLLAMTRAIGRMLDLVLPPRAS